MKLSISYLAKLAHFNLSDDQEKQMEKSIPSVIAYMEEIKNLDTKNVPETSFATEEQNVTREDTVEPSLTQEEALKNAKKTYNGFFVVPYIFEE